MQELRPLVDEYRELEQVAQRLGVPPQDRADTPASARRTTRPARNTRRAAATTRSTAAAASGRSPGRGRQNGRRERLLSMVKARPGISVRGVGSEPGVDPTSLYRIVHRLEKEGKLQKRGRELRVG